MNMKKRWNAFRKFWYRYSRVCIGSFMLVVLIIAAIFAPQLSGQDPNLMSMKDALQPPSAALPGFKAVFGFLRTVLFQTAIPLPGNSGSRCR